MGDESPAQTQHPTYWWIVNVPVYLTIGYIAFLVVEALI